MIAQFVFYLVIYFFFSFALFLLFLLFYFFWFYPIIFVAVAVWARRSAVAGGLVSAGRDAARSLAVSCAEQRMTLLRRPKASAQGPTQLRIVGARRAWALGKLAETWIGRKRVGELRAGVAGVGNRQGYLQKERAGEEWCDRIQEGPKCSRATVRKNPIGFPLTKSLWVCLCVRPAPTRFYWLQARQRYDRIGSTTVSEPFQIQRNLKQLWNCACAHLDEQIV